MPDHVKIERLTPMDEDYLESHVLDAWMYDSLPENLSRKHNPALY